MAANDGQNVNVNVQRQLNDLLTQRRTLLEGQVRLFEQQLELARQLVSALGGVSTDRIVEGMQTTTERLRELSSAAENAGDASTQSLRRMARAGRSVGGVFDGLTATKKRWLPLWSKVAGLGGFALNRLWRLGELVTSAIEGAVSMTWSLVTAAWELGKSIIAIPFKILGGLIDWAQGIQPYVEMAQAIENVRKQFGSFNQLIAGSVMATFRKLRGTLEHTNLSFGRILGFPHEKLEFITRTATEMGMVFEALAGHFVANAESMIAFQKGLGFTDELMKVVGIRALAFGTPAVGILYEINDQVQQMAMKGFAGSAKTLSRAVGTMIKDVKNFGSLTVRQMIAAATYTHSLGVEMERILGIVDAFDNFEDAATRVSQLAQAFGLNVDTLRMMEEQDPSRRIDMLRSSMREAGRSAEMMSRQELKLLASQTGLDEATAQQVFSMKNMGRSYDDIQRASKMAEKQPLSQAQAMQKLAEAIERVIKVMQTSGGLFSMFFQGFAKGIERSSAFWKMLQNIRRVAHMLFWEGYRLGRLFVSAFPGVKKLVSAIGQLFDPERWSIMLRRMRPLWRQFFADPEHSTGKLLDGMRTFFEQVFGTEILDAIRKGLVLVGRGMVSVFAGLLRYAIIGLTNGIRLVVEFIRAPGTFAQRISAAFNKVMGEVSSDASTIFEPLINVFKDQRLMGDLAAAFATLWNETLGRIDWTKIWADLKAQLDKTLDAAKAWFADIGKKIVLSIVFGFAAQWALSNVWRAVVTSFNAKSIMGIGPAMQAAGGGLVKALLKGGLITSIAVGLADGLMAAWSARGVGGKVEAFFANAGARILSMLTLGIVDKDSIMALGDRLSGAIISSPWLDTLQQKHATLVSSAVADAGRVGEYRARRREIDATTQSLKEAYGVLGSGSVLASELNQRFNSAVDAQRRVEEMHANWFVALREGNAVQAALVMSQLDVLKGNAAEQLKQLKSVESATKAQIAVARNAAVSLANANVAIAAQNARESAEDAIRAFNEAEIEGHIAQRQDRSGPRKKAKASRGQRSQRSALETASAALEGIDTSRITEAAEMIRTARIVLRDIPKLESAVKAIEQSAFKTSQGVLKTKAAMIVTQMVDEVNLIGAELDKLTKGSIDIVPKLNALGKVITGKDTVRINNKNFSINIAMHVKLDAVELARQLADLKFKKKESDNDITFFDTTTIQVPG